MLKYKPVLILFTIFCFLPISQSYAGCVVEIIKIDNEEVRRFERCSGGVSSPIAGVPGTIGNSGEISSGFGNPIFGGQQSGQLQTPQEPPKTPRQICKAEIKTGKSICLARAAGIHATQLRQLCLDNGTYNFSIGGISGNISLGASATFDTYLQCKDLLDSEKDRDTKTCESYYAAQEESCP